MGMAYKKEKDRTLGKGKTNLHKKFNYQKEI
jgi:hypothetical protein